MRQALLAASRSTDCSEKLPALSVFRKRYQTDIPKASSHDSDLQVRLRSI